MSAVIGAEQAGVRLHPESVEAISRRVAELLRNAEGARSPKQLISAAKVAELWGVDREWVYAHADQLGARRLGAGKRPRLRFDPEEVEERIAALGGCSTPDRRGSGRFGASRQRFALEPRQSYRCHTAGGDRR